MIKTVFLFLLMTCSTPVWAQYNTKIYNQYLDFNEAQSKNENAKAMLIADSILHGSEKLPAKAQTSFYRRLAKLYEDQHQPEKAIIYNEKVLQAVPNFLYFAPGFGLLVFIADK